MLQRSATNSSPLSEAPPIVNEVLHSPGQPLDANIRAFMEPRFGHDFSNVRVHTDAKAAESARAVNALAYTVGRDVVFGAGQYIPSSNVGRKLVAHELTHVVQQSPIADFYSNITLHENIFAEREARAAANNIEMDNALPINISIKSRARLDRNPGDEDESDEPDVLTPGENFRWIGEPSRPSLAVRPAWLRTMGVPYNTHRITAKRFPHLFLILFEQLVPMYPWASMERVKRGLKDLKIALSSASWQKEETHVPVHRSVFLTIGLPPDNPVQIFRTEGGIQFYADTTPFYEDVNGDQESLQSAKVALAENIAQMIEQEMRAQMIPSQRHTFVERLTQHAPNEQKVWAINFEQADLIGLFGEIQWRQYAGQRRDTDDQEGAVIQIEGSGTSVRLPPGLNMRDREQVMRLLHEITTPIGSTSNSSASLETQPPAQIFLTPFDIDALKALDTDQNREELIALLRQGRSRTQDRNQPTLADIIETARAALTWRRSEQSLGIEFQEVERDELPIAPRPVHGRILNPDRLVPGLEAHFQFETIDPVDAFRVPMVSIHWFARKVPSEDQPNPPVIEDDVTHYIEVRPHGLLNERIFEVTFDEPGDYEIHAFVNHNFFLPAHFTSVVRVVTEAAILEEFRGRAESGWGHETGSQDYKFEGIAEQEQQERVAAGLGGIGLVSPVGGIAPVLGALPSSGYEMGTRAEGTLTEWAAGEVAMSFSNRKEQLQAESAHLDEMIRIYEHSPDSNAQAIVEQIRERKSRVQHAVDQLDHLMELEGNPANPVPVRAYFASRTQGIPSAPLTLVVYFFYEAEGENLRFHGHVLDQSELVESRHYHYEANASSFEGMMEALFNDLTQSYPNGSVSFAFQVYDEVGSTSRFIRYERVTDTLEQDVRDVVFSSVANITVNLVATLLTIFPPTTVLGLSLGIAYNAAALASEISQDLRRDTFSTERTALQLGQIALDTIPLVGRSTELLVLSGRAYRVIEATQLAGLIYLLTEDAELQIENLRDGQIIQLGQLRERIHQIESVNASDPELDTLRRQETEMISSIRDASFDVYSELIASQALTIGSAALLRHVAEPYLTGRNLGQPGTHLPRRGESEQGIAHPSTDEPTLHSRQEASSTPTEQESKSTTLQDLEDLRRIALTDRDAAMELWRRYQQMSDFEIFKRVIDDGDETATTILRQRYPSNESALRKVLGSDYRPPHEATAVLRRNGNEIWRQPLQSGHMTPAEHALGFPRNMLATHTEARAVRHADLHPGDFLDITGQYDPCRSCQRAMQEAATRTGAKIRYWWPGGSMDFNP